MILQTCFKSTVPGYMSLGQVIDILNDDVINHLTLKRRIKYRHLTMRRAIKDPRHPKFWIIPDADVKLLKDESARLRGLKDLGYSVSVAVAEKKLGLDANSLLRKDIGQERIFGVWKISEKMLRHLQRIGKNAVEKLPGIREDLLTKAGAKSGDRPAMGPADEWLNPWKIRSVPGALRPHDYASRARRAEGTCTWAKKENGRWLLRRGYIEADAEANLKYIGGAEMARLLGCSTKTVRNWIDAGRIPCEGRSTTESERLVLRKRFLKLLPFLGPRLETSAIVAVQKRHGHKVPEVVVERVEAKQKIGELGTWIEEAAPKEDALREELRCGRVGTLYLGKKPRSEKVIIHVLNALQEIRDEAIYNQFRFNLKLAT